MDAANLTVAADSGPAELKLIYQANLGYDVDNDQTAARQFVKACRAILALPVDTNNAVEGVRFNRELIENQLNEANRWFKRATRRRPRVFVPDARFCK